MIQKNQRIALQIVISLCAIIPIFGGLNGIYYGPKMIEKAYNYPILVDSQFRYLSGLPLAMGMLLLRSLPTIDRDGSDLRRVTLLVFIGGLGRLYGLITVDFNFGAMIATLGELFAFPLVCVWQYQIQQKTKQSRIK
ncbi:unnamed protein product [Rotaria sp. Silwood1]|nr:unnamed protein product [Rotaria sp. Silwood1]